MAKSEKELQELKNKLEELSQELKELSDEELDQIAGGSAQKPDCPPKCRFNHLNYSCICPES